MRTAIYARISDDKAGNRAGVERQVGDCTQLAKARGWQLVATFIDNSASAYNGGPRPEYTRLLDLVADGQLDAVVAWHTDRLWRSVSDQQAFLLHAAEHGLRVVATPSGDTEIGNSDSEFVQTIGAAVAQKSSADMSRRLRRKHQQIAEQGLPSGGGTRPFGFLSDKVTHHPDEAPVVAELARRVATGESIRSLVADLERRGVGTVKGGRWGLTGLRRLLTSPRVGGHRGHKGQLYPAAWEPIIDAETREAVLARLTERNGRRPRPQPPRRYLLTGGLLRCGGPVPGLRHVGGCGGVLTAQPRSDGRRAYSCKAGPGEVGCGSRYTLADPIEEHVRDLLFAALRSPEVAQGLQEADQGGELAEALAQLEVVEGRLQRVHDDYYDDTIDKLTYTRQRTRIEEQRDAARRHVDRLAGRQVAIDVPTDQIEAWWQDATLEQRRLLLGRLVGHVVLGPARRGVNRFDEGRVHPVWRA